MKCDHNQPISGDCAECDELASKPDPTKTVFLNCPACHGRRGWPEHETADCCTACYEDGGPHAGDDPFGRSDEDWARHAE